MPEVFSVSHSVRYTRTDNKACGTGSTHKGCSLPFRFYALLLFQRFCTLTTLFWVSQSKLANLLYACFFCLSRAMCKSRRFLEMRPVRMGFFGDTLRKPLEKQGIPYHLAVTLIQNKLQKSACLVLQYPYRTF